MGYFLLGLAIGTIVGVVIMACCAAAGFASETERWTHDRER